MQYELANRKKNPLIDIFIGVADKGGVEAVINTTAEYLTKRGFRIRLVQAVWEHHPWTSEMIEFHYLYDDRKNQDSEKFKEAYRAFLEQNEKPDLILATNWPVMSMIARQVKEELALSCMIVSWLHNPIERYEAAGYGGTDFLRFADAHFAINQRIKNRIQREIPGSVVYPVNNPVSAERTVQSDRRRKNRLVFIGRLEDQKNLPVILMGLQQAGGEWSLQVIGEGKREKDWKKLAKELLLEERVSFSGWSDNPWEEAKDAGFLVMSSVFEGFPVTAIEALLSGMPVISTPVDGIVELIRPGENGYLFPFGDSTAFAEILNMLEEGKLPVPDAEACQRSASAFQKEPALFDFYVKLSATLEGRILPDREGFYGDDRISVIVPFYNAEKRLARCLDSVLAQTIGLLHLELILINDASTDRSREIAGEYETRFPDQILVIDCEKNGRPGTARNIGMDYAGGQYLTFVDSDDTVSPHMLEELYLFLVIWNTEMAECGYEKIREEDQPLSDSRDDGRMLYSSDSEEEQRSLFLSNAWMTGAWRRLYRKDLLREHAVRFAENIRMEEAPFSLTLFMKCRSFGRLNRNMYYYYQNPDGIMNSKSNREYYMDVFRVHQLAVEEAKTRGLFLQFRKELAYVYLQKVYFGLTEFMKKTFSDFPADRYREIKEYLKREFPDIRENPYLKEEDRGLLDQYEREFG